MVVGDLDEFGCIVWRICGEIILDCFRLVPICREQVYSDSDPLIFFLLFFSLWKGGTGWMN